MGRPVEVLSGGEVEEEGGLKEDEGTWDETGAKEEAVSKRVINLSEPVSIKCQVIGRESEEELQIVEDDSQKHPIEKKNFGTLIERGTPDWLIYQSSW